MSFLFLNICILFRVVTLDVFRENHVRKTSSGHIQTNVQVGHPPADGQANGLVLQWFCNDLAMVLCPADGHPDHWAERPSTSRSLNVVTDQRLEWPSAMPFASADRWVEWQTSAGASDIQRIHVRIRRTSGCRTTLILLLKNVITSLLYVHQTFQLPK
jgi:hypothetical protein